MRVHEIKHVVLLDRGRNRVKVRPSQAVLALLHAHTLLKVSELIQVSVQQPGGYFSCCVVH